uniref:DUF3878 family protein n=1 Tax=Eubacterium cellulosolvens TaxID=29322 RepID=UPI0004835539|nr:DUF3878 family protein [[Eubacterium] cellulosolvens]
MKRKLSREILKDRLYALIESETLEFVSDSDDRSVMRIPYMMSDAVEDYLEFTGVEIIGEIPKRNIRKQDGGIENDIHSLIITDADILGNEISFRAGLQPVFTMRYREQVEWNNLYQYHRTGHYWVQGAEHIRRVFYILSLIYDKIQYLGPDAGNDLERRLAKLVEFAPLRYWSPTKTSMEDWYMTTKEGNRVMEEIAREAGDKHYASMVSLFNSVPTVRQKEKLAKYLAEPKGEKIYRHMISLINEASEPYPARSYGADNDIRIQGMRRRIQNDLERRDFEGKWPNFQREEQLVTIIEEQPFTILDWEDAQYKFYMDVTLRSFLHPEHHVEDIPGRDLQLLPPGMSWEEFRVKKEEKAKLLEQKKAEEEAARAEAEEAREQAELAKAAASEKVIPWPPEKRSEKEAPEAARQAEIFSELDVSRELEAQKSVMKAMMLQETAQDPERTKDDIFEELKRVSRMAELNEPKLSEEEKVALELTRIAQEMRKVHM